MGESGAFKAPVDQIVSIVSLWASYGPVLPVPGAIQALVFLAF
jgi:hypothetical protein